MAAVGLLRRIQHAGPRGVLHAVLARLPRRRARAYRLCRDRLAGGRGLEIGGPTNSFRRHGFLPVYPVVGRLDNCNFSRTTTWERDIAEGATFVYDGRRPPGYQYIGEATDLSNIPSATYDFVLSSHTLEHIANPLRALAEWRRVLRPGGTLVLVMPHRERTFDHRRPVTPLAHLVEDLERGVEEDDLTHLPEILTLHDLSRDTGAGGLDAFSERSRNNHENRALHHHVFDPDAVREVVEHVDFRVLWMEMVEPHHILAVCEKNAELTESE